MSGCSSGMAGSQFCESCHDYNCASNPYNVNYDTPPSSSSYNDKVSDDFYIKNGLEHLKGTKAPDIPIIDDIKKETKEIINKLYDNFLIE